MTIFGISKEEAKKLAREEVVSLLKEKDEELKQLGNEINSLQERLTHINSLMSSITGVEISTNLHPLALAFFSKKLHDHYYNALRMMQSEMEHMFPHQKYQAHYVMPKLETRKNIQLIDAKSGLIIMGLRNDGCKGKYAISAAGRNFFDIYTRTKGNTILFPIVLLLRPDYRFSITKIEGTVPSFELLGVEYR